MDKITCFCEDGSCLWLADDSGLVTALPLLSAGDTGYGPWYQTLDAERPLFCLFEVSDMSLKFPGRGFGIMLSRLFNLGYNAEWRAVDTGRQVRVFVFVFRRDTLFSRGLFRNYYKRVLDSEGFMARAFPVEELGPLAVVRGVKLDLDLDWMRANFACSFENAGCLRDGWAFMAYVTDVPCDVPVAIRVERVLGEVLSNEL